MQLEAGSRLGHYEILGLAGKGGMGEVYRARDMKLNREVAIKVLPEAFIRDPSGSCGSTVKPTSSPHSTILTSPPSMVSKR